MKDLNDTGTWTLHGRLLWYLVQREPRCIYANDERDMPFSSLESALTQPMVHSWRRQLSPPPRIDHPSQVFLGSTYATL